MDPFLFTRIGDVTIQRVSPKQDAPKKETAAGHHTSVSSSPSGELDLSMKTRSSRSIDKADDKGGGESSYGDASKNFDYSDASDEDEEGDLSDEDEQDVPLSLVTTKRNPVESSGYSLTNSASMAESVSCSTSKSNVGTQENVMDKNKSADSNNQFILNQLKDIGLDKDLSDNDDDLPLSRFIAEADSEAVGGESEGEEDKDNASRDKNVSTFCFIFSD